MEGLSEWLCRSADEAHDTPWNVARQKGPQTSFIHMDLGEESFIVKFDFIWIWNYHIFVLKSDWYWLMKHLHPVSGTGSWKSWWSISSVPFGPLFSQIKRSLQTGDQQIGFDKAHLPSLKLTVRPWKYVFPKETSIPPIHFQGRSVSFRECIPQKNVRHTVSKGFGSCF